VFIRCYPFCEYYQENERDDEVDKIYSVESGAVGNESRFPIDSCLIEDNQSAFCCANLNQSRAEI
jgi:hypothetical protein